MDHTPHIYFLARLARKEWHRLQRKKNPRHKSTFTTILMKALMNDHRRNKNNNNLRKKEIKVLFLF